MTSNNHQALMTKDAVNTRLKFLPSRGFTVFLRLGLRAAGYRLH